MRQVNLLPEEFKKGGQIRDIKRGALIVFVPTVILMIVIVLILGATINVLTEKEKNPLGHVKTDAIFNLEERIDSIGLQIQQKIDRNHFAAAILADYYSFGKILKVIGDASKGKVWLSEYNVDGHSGICHIDGTAFNTRFASEFMLELKKSSYFESVDITSMQRDELGGKGVHFLIKLTLQ